MKKRVGGANPKGHHAYGRTQKEVSSQLSIIEKNLQKVLDDVNLAVEEGVNEIAGEIHNKSLAIAPYDTGELIDSLFMETEVAANKYTVIIGYKAEHSVFASTNANRGHDYIGPTTPDTHWKFLLHPAQEVEGDAVKILERAIKKKLK